MYLSHINITMPKGGEELARSFYVGQLGLREIQKPRQLQDSACIWLDAGGFELHLSVEEMRAEADTRRHFGLGGDVDGLRARLEAAGVATEDGPPSPRKRFFVHDPFGNRIEIHTPGAALA
jgi:catechol 2,3-dioxygenase-like lactoylglutathione lyase family enzyme